MVGVITTQKTVIKRDAETNIVIIYVGHLIGGSHST